ncbi:MAG: hypothetical protein VW496_05000 [Pelagibacteraceae bacterium]
MLCIFDLDGTVIDSSHRQLTQPDGTLNLQAWRDRCTPAMIAQDGELPLIHWARECIARGYEVIACTAREMSAADYDWLREHGLEFSAILSRPVGCTLPDARLKVMLLADFARMSGESLMSLGARSVFWDDSASVRDTLADFGFSMLNPAQVQYA